MNKGLFIATAVSILGFAGGAHASTVTEYNFDAVIESTGFFSFSGLTPVISPVSELPAIGSVIAGSITIRFDEASAGTGSSNSAEIVNCDIGIIECQFSLDGFLDAFDPATGLVNISTVDIFRPASTEWNLISGSGRVEYQTLFDVPLLGMDEGTFAVEFSMTNIQVQPVPLPAPVAMLGSGLVLLGALRARNKRKTQQQD